MGFKKKYVEIIIVFVLFIPFSLNALEVVFFPEDKLLTNHHSGLLRSSAVDVPYTFSTKDNKHYTLFNAGAKISGISFRANNGIRYDIGGYGGIFSRFELFSESFNFIHADFIGAISLDIGYKSFVFETSVYHNSSHIGDDYIYYNEGKIKNIGYEAIKHYTNYNVKSFLDLSVGFEYKFLSRERNIIFYDKSFFLGSRIDLITLVSKKIPVFFEIEIEIIGFNHGPNIGIKGGVYLSYILNNVFLNNNIEGKEMHEFSIYYYYGYSKMGCFYNTKESLFLIGPTFRF